MSTNTEGFFIAPTINNSITVAPNTSIGSIAAMIEDLKDLLVASGWTLVGSTAASGFVYTPGWAVAYRPTRFWDFPGKIGAVYDTVNDVGSCEACAAGDDIFSSPANSFGNNESSVLCKRGFWNGYIDCLGNPWTSILICDTDGNPINPGAEPHNGAFTGTFKDFADAVTSDCSPYYKSFPHGFSRDGVPIPQNNIHVYIQAKLGGPKYNAPNFATAIGVGDANGGPAYTIAGGGYRLRSQKANGSTQFELLITMYRSPIDGGIGIPQQGQLLPGNSENLDFGQISIRVKELLTNSEVEYILGSGTRGTEGTYVAIANPYMLFMSSTSNVDEYNHNFGGGNSFMAVAPFTRNPNLQYCLLVVGPNTLKNNVVWMNATSSYAINGPFETYVANSGIYTGESGSGWPGLMCRTFAYPGKLTTTNGRPIAQTSWVMSSRTKGKEATILGTLWNSMIISQEYPQRSELSYQDQIYMRVSGQVVAPECSLWMSLGSSGLIL